MKRLQVWFSERKNLALAAASCVALLSGLSQGPMFANTTSYFDSDPSGGCEGAVTGTGTVTAFTRSAHNDPSTCASEEFTVTFAHSETCRAGIGVIDTAYVQ